MIFKVVTRCYQSTYEELKQNVDIDTGEHIRSYQSTYEELKLDFQSSFNSNQPPVISLPMRN